MAGEISNRPHWSKASATISSASRIAAFMLDHRIAASVQKTIFGNASHQFHGRRIIPASNTAHAATNQYGWWINISLNSPCARTFFFQHSENRSSSSFFEIDLVVKPRRSALSAIACDRITHPHFLQKNSQWANGCLQLRHEVVLEKDMGDG